MISSLNEKPDLNQNLNNKSEDSSKPKDPFSPPFEEGLYIDEITSTHRLLYNKFSLAPEHVLVVTKEMDLQTDPLN